MITLPEDVKQGDNWDGVDGEVLGTPNLESKMTFAEHQRIVCEARALLAGALALDPETVAVAALRHLKTAYTENAAGYVLKISKGIHQPFTNPHMQLNLLYKPAQGKQSSWLFHLNVTVPDEEPVGLTADYKRFHWKGAQFTAKIGQTEAKWPVNAVIVPKTKAAANKRMSIAPDEIQGVIEEQAKIEAALKAAKAKADAQKLAQQKFEKDKLLVVQKLDGQQMQKASPQQLKSLIEGKSVKLKTKNGKDKTVTWDGSKLTMT